MGEPLLPKKIKSEPLAWWQENGITLSGAYGYPISTPISDGDGKTYGFSVELTHAETFSDIYFARLELQWSDIDGKILPTAGPDVDVSRDSTLFGTGRRKLLYSSFSKSGSSDMNVYSTSAATIGKSTLTIKNPYDGGSTSGSGIEVASSTGVTISKKVSDRFALYANPAFSYGVVYDKEGASINRLYLSAMLYAGIEISPESDKSGEGKDETVGIYANVNEFLKIGHGLIFREYMNKTLSDPTQNVNDIGFSTSGGSTKGPLQIVPSFMAASTLLGGLSYSNDVPLHSDYYWALLAAQGAGGIMSMSGDSKAGQSAGIGDMIRGGWLLSYSLFGIESVGARRSLTREQIAVKEELAALAGTALGFAAAAYGHYSDSEVMSGGATSGLLPIVTNPTSLSDSANKIYLGGYAPRSGRGVLVIQNNFRQLPVVAGAEVLYGGSEKDIDITMYAGPALIGERYYAFLAAAATTTFGAEGRTSMGAEAGLGLFLGKNFILDGRARYSTDDKNPFEYTLNAGFFF